MQKIINFYADGLNCTVVAAVGVERQRGHHWARAVVRPRRGLVRRLEVGRGHVAQKGVQLPQGERVVQRLKGADPGHVLLA